ncbi:MAG: rhomboid family intramembrane serine protease [Syntrophaceae bacterium]|nr:rhomboid family intramembrane serine protease [Syntrophaceae bacterium]
MIPLKDTIPRIGIPLITWILVLLNAIIFIFEISIPKDILEEVFYFFGLVPARYSSPKWALIHGLSPKDYFPFLSNMFLHAGWLHIIGNMWFLYLFGSSVEDRMGHIRFLILYLLTGLAANILFFTLDIHSMIPEFGASGAIAGVMGAYIVMFPRARILTLIPIFLFPFFFYLPALFYLGFWFLIQLFSGTLSFTSPGTGGVAWWAHVGGFLAGMAFVPVFRNRRHSYREPFPDETYHHIYR